jgi:hypothetical protein
VAARSSITEAPPASRFWGPLWDHTSYATVNEPRFCERHTPARQPQKPSANWVNAAPPLPGGQVVAGSNPVSPTQKRSLDLRRCKSLQAYAFRREAELSQIVTRCRVGVTECDRVQSSALVVALSFSGSRGVVVRQTAFSSRAVGTRHRRVLAVTMSAALPRTVAAATYRSLGAVVIASTRSSYPSMTARQNSWAGTEMFEPRSSPARVISRPK